MIDPANLPAPWATAAILAGSYGVAVYVADRFIQQQRGKMRANRIQIFKNKLRELDYAEFDATAAIRDGKKTPQDVLAEMYADLGEERDAFEYKAKKVEALEAENTQLKAAWHFEARRSIELTEKLAGIEAQNAELLTQNADLTQRKERFKVNLNALYGKMGNPQGFHTSVSGTNKVVELLAKPEAERSKRVQKMGIRMLRKLFPVALDEIHFIREKLRAKTIWADAEFQRGVEQGTSEERAKNDQQRAELTMRIDRTDQKITETEILTKQLRELIERHKHQLDESLARETELTKKLDIQRTHANEQVQRRFEAQTRLKDTVAENRALRGLCRAQNVVVELHLGETEP